MPYFYMIRAAAPGQFDVYLDGEAVWLGTSERLALSFISTGMADAWYRNTSALQTR